MIDNLDVIVPFYNGHDTIERLLRSIPDSLPVTVVDDRSHRPPARSGKADYISMEKKGFFAGAVNKGLSSTNKDVLILNQDVWFEGTDWLNVIAENRDKYAVIGDGVFGHPAWPNGYVQGTFMFMRRDAIDRVGLLNKAIYPLWGCTCEWQLRACRAGYKALPLKNIDGFNHERNAGQAYGSSIKQVLAEYPDLSQWFIRTPPFISVVIPAHNEADYLQDAVNSLVGGNTSLGEMPGQTFQSFEIIIVDDASTDHTPEICEEMADDWKGIRYVRLDNSGHDDGKPGNGSPFAVNRGIEASFANVIARLDGDDMMEPDRLDYMVRTLSANKHSFVYDHVRAFADGKRGKKWPLPNYDFDILIEKNLVHAGIMFPKTAWRDAKGYPEVMRYGREDWAFNVALGVKGWCGVRVDKAGYLYRREGQGRTIENTTPSWRKYFLGQMTRLFPGIYKGERPMACCGGDGTSGGGESPPIPDLPGKDGLVVLEYIGPNHGDEPWYGAVTGRRYTLGGVRRRGYVDIMDAPKLLEVWEAGGPIFKIIPPDSIIEPPVASLSGGESVVVSFDEPDETAVIQDDEPNETAVIVDPNDMKTVGLIKAAISKGLSSAKLTAMLKYETSGEDRKTAVVALKKALVNA